MKRQNRRIVRRSVLGTTAALAWGMILASALFAKPGVIKTTSGQTYQGDISEQGDNYVVTIGKIDTRIAKGDVASVQYSGTIDEQFNEQMKKLDPKDANGRVAVAKFAFNNGRYDLAVQALSSAMLIDPNNAAAMEMLKTVQAQQNMEQARAAAAKAPEAPTAEATPPDMAASGTIEKKLLTPADINSIRQQEIKPGETVPMSISNDLKRKFAAKVGMTFTAFNDLSQAEQLKMILDKGDPETKAAVKILKDPIVIADYKRAIQPMILRNCATSGCHGGPAGGRFILFNGNDDATTYTNFYIMEKFSQKVAGDGGFFSGGGQRKLIQRGDGAHSLLANYGLPAGIGDPAHPKVENGNFNGIFRSRDDRLYQTVVDWMDKDFNLIEPNYDIKYTPPTGSGPASRPTSAPAGSPR